MRYIRREKKTGPLSAEEEQELRESFEKEPSWVKKIDERVDLADLLACMQTLTVFYTERAEETKVRLGLAGRCSSTEGAH